MALAPKLSQKEHALVNGILSGKRKTESARAAGYTEATIRGHLHEILKRPAVVMALGERRDRIAAAIDFGPKGIMARLQRVSEAAETDRQYGPAVRALELAGKQQGMFRDRIEVAGAAPTAEGLKALEGDIKALLRAVLEAKIIDAEFVEVHGPALTSLVGPEVPAPIPSEATSVPKDL